jgi:hypothetical protein
LLVRGDATGQGRDRCADDDDQVRVHRRTVYLQRFINGGWQTMLGHTTDINGANTFGFIQAKAYNYRVITTDSTTSWGRTGGAAAK